MNAEENYYVIPELLMMDLKVIFAIKIPLFNYMVLPHFQTHG